MLIVIKTQMRVLPEDGMPEYATTRYTARNFDADMIRPYTRSVSASARTLLLSVISIAFYNAAIRRGR